MLVGLGSARLSENPGLFRWCKMLGGTQSTLPYDLGAADPSSSHSHCWCSILHHLSVQPNIHVLSPNKNRRLGNYWLI